MNEDNKKDSILGTPVSEEVVLKELGDPKTWAEHTAKVLEEYYKRPNSTSKLKDELQVLINKYLVEDKYTEDGLLAHYLVDILKNYDIMFTIADNLEFKE